MHPPALVQTTSQAQESEQSMAPPQTPVDTMPAPPQRMSHGPLPQVIVLLQLPVPTHSMSQLEASLQSRVPPMQEPAEKGLALPQVTLQSPLPQLIAPGQVEAPMQPISQLFAAPQSMAPLQVLMTLQLT